MGEKEKQNKGVLAWNGEWCGKHTLGKGSGRETNRLLDDPEGILTRNKKQLVKP